MDRLFAADAPYGPREIAVVLAIARHMDRATCSCFPAYERISRQTRVSVRDISRILTRHCQDSSAPLLARRFSGIRRSYTYELVRDPEAFAQARDAQPKPAKRPRKAGPTKNRAQTAIAVIPKIAPLASATRSRFRPDRKPWMGECTCGASIARWDDGRIFVMVGGIVTTEMHTCPVNTGMPNGPTNTSDTDPADMPDCPTNTGGQKIEVADALQVTP